MKLALYPHDFKYAREHNDVTWSRVSNKINNACAKYIEERINSSMKELYHYDLACAADEVSAKYGLIRTTWVVAAIINGQDWDGRYSLVNKEWAKKAVNQAAADTQWLSLNTHPVLLNGFTDYLRELSKEADLTQKTEDDVVDKISQKVLASQIEYKESLLKMKPEEILSHTAEYTLREDIVYHIGDMFLDSTFTYENATALANTPDPLAKIYDQYRDDAAEYEISIRNDAIRDAIQTCGSTASQQEVIAAMECDESTSESGKGMSRSKQWEVFYREQGNSDADLHTIIIEASDADIAHKQAYDMIDELHTIVGFVAHEIEDEAEEEPER